MNIFINASGRLRSAWRLLIFSIIFMIAYLCLGILVHLTLVGDSPAGPSSDEQPQVALLFLLHSIIVLVAALIAGWVCTRALERLPARALGWTLHRYWWRDFLVGSFIGGTSLILPVLVGAATGRYTLSTPVINEAVVRSLASSLCIFLIAAAAEETLFRGYPFQTLLRGTNQWMAMLLPVTLFGASHLMNPNVVSRFTFFNTALIGLLMALAFLRTRSLWFPLGIHWAWNWVQGALLGITVSGFTEFAPASLITTRDAGPSWLTGGRYGIEGGAACTIVIICASIFVRHTTLVSADSELIRFSCRKPPRSVGTGQAPTG